MTADAAAVPDPHGPVRTCIGCRRKGPRSVLVRMVATEVDGRPQVVPDPGRRLPGRGAWLHRDPGCVAQAQRRKAFTRALRVAGDLDAAGVADLGPRPGAPDSTTSTNRERVDE